MSPHALLPALAPLYTAVVADVLDAMGHRRQTLSDRFRPLTPATRVCGVVFPARAAAAAAAPERPYELEIAAVDALAPGEVLVVGGGDFDHCALWGELLTTACLAKGAAGVVMSARARDTWRLRELNFPVFGLGRHPADSKGRLDVVELGQPIEIDGVTIRRGDLLLGDEDGVVVVPQAAAEEAIRLAREKVAGENTVREELRQGVPLGEVFRRHGLL